jgi:hypothetical protein
LHRLIAPAFAGTFIHSISSLANASSGTADAFQAAGLELPKISVVTLSVPIRIDLIVTGKFISIISKSLAERYSLKILPVELNVRPWSVVIISLKNRTLSPVVQRFIECCRDVQKSVDKTYRYRKPIRITSPACQVKTSGNVQLQCVTCGQHYQRRRPAPTCGRGGMAEGLGPSPPCRFKSGEDGWSLPF